MATALVASGAVIATAATGPASAEAGSFKDLITIEPGTGFNAISYYDSNGTRTSQPLANAKGSCNLSDDGSGAGVLQLGGSFTGSTGTNNVGLNTGFGSLGIAEKKSGNSCAQVEVANNESMTLTMPKTSPKGISANLDIEVQKDAVVLAELSLTGRSTPERFTFYSGKSVPSRTLTANEDSCRGSDTSSGPNSGTSDNCRWEINPNGKFDKIVLTAQTAGQFSLEGGADGLLTDAPSSSSGLPQRASFIRVEPVLGCGQSTFTLNFDGTTTPGVKVRRLDNADPNQKCQGFTYDLQNKNARVTFVKPTDTQTSVQFVMDLKWPVDPTATAQLKPVTFQFHDKNGSLQYSNTITLGWCANPVIQQGLVTGLLVNPLTDSSIVDMQPADATLGDLWPGKQYACATAPVLEMDAKGNPVDWYEQVYILGDAMARN